MIEIPNSAFYALHDLDNHLAKSAQAIIDWSNGWVDHDRLGIKKLTLLDYHENFPKLWGVTPEEGNERWAEYCETGLGEVAPIDEMRQVIQRLPVNIVHEILTSRGQHTVTTTHTWATRHYPTIKRVHHATTDWRNDPNAHMRTKAESIRHYLASGCLPRLPDLMADDTPLHLRGCRDLRVNGDRIEHIILSGDYPWNKEAQKEEGLVWLPTPELFEEYVLEAAARKQRLTE
jgi:hypothetical protein